MNRFEFKPYAHCAFVRTNRVRTLTGVLAVGIDIGFAFSSTHTRVYVDSCGIFDFFSFILVVFFSSLCI